MAYEPRLLMNRFRIGDWGGHQYVDRDMTLGGRASTLACKNPAALKGTDTKWQTGPKMHIFCISQWNPFLKSIRAFLLVLSVLKHCVPETLAFAFGLRLHSKTRCFKTRVLGRRLPNEKPQERL